MGRKQLKERYRKKPVTFYINDEVYEKLCEKADKLGISVSPAIAIAVNKWLLEELEHYETISGLCLDWLEEKKKKRR